VQARILIREGTTSYLTPVKKDFEAICEPEHEKLLDQALEALKGKGRASIELAAQIRCGGKVVMRFRGSFVMIAGEAESGA
jgi:thioesterase domain-containing protein